MSHSAQPVHPRAALLYPDFRFFASARFLALLSHQMLNVAAGQYVYELTRNPLHLGYIGLFLFLPKLIFTILGGQVADRYDRRRIILTCRVLQFFAILGLIMVVHRADSPLSLLYALLFLMGMANAFDGPASQSIVPQLVTTEHFSNAVTWNASTMQTALIAGPAVGGWIYGVSGKALTVFYVVALLRLISAFLVAMIKSRTAKLDRSVVSLETLLAGIRYVYQKKIILGAISLDLFAVLLGGAVALLPIYANEILKVGPSGLGMLRAAPALGAALMAMSLTYLPPFKKAGKAMFICVAIFGLATICFGISKNFHLSLLFLFILGASDMISVVIRGVLVQIKTPDAMRGRVSAVNLVFIGASNELGEFESGLTASWFGVIPAVILGGVGTLAVVALWAWKFPDLRKFKRIDELA